jgi:hypothetical protein
LPDPEYIIVFTGTRDGMTEAQKTTVYNALKRGKKLKHGLCVGADADCHNLWIWNLRRPISTVEVYPCNIPRMVAQVPVSNVRKPEHPLKRNRRMIEEAIKEGKMMVLAAPRNIFEERRSGTWATIRYAQMMGVPLLIVWPDGEWDWQNGDTVAWSANNPSKRSSSSSSRS